MAMKIAVGPAMTSADRGSPERLAPDGADNAADYRAGRSGDDEAGSSARHGANGIGVRR